MKLIISPARAPCRLQDTRKSTGDPKSVSGNRHGQGGHGPGRRRCMPGLGRAQMTLLPVILFSCGVTKHADRPMPWPARTGRGQVSRPRADGSLAECGCLAHWHYRTQNTTSKPAIAHAAGCSAKDSDCGRHCGSDHGGRCALNRHGHSDHRALAGFKSSLRSQSKSPAFGPTCRLRRSLRSWPQACPR